MYLDPRWDARPHIADRRPRGGVVASALIVLALLAILSPAASAQLLYPEPQAKPKRQGNTVPPAEIGWVSMKQALEGASAASSSSQSTQRSILIYVYAPWCPYCKKMNEEVLTDTKVQSVLREYFQSVQINTELEDPVEYLGQRFTHSSFARALGNQSIPTIYFMNAKGEVFANQPGVLPVDVLQRLLHYVGTESYSRVPFDEYTMP